MEKRDARKLAPEAQLEIRRQAVKLHLEGLTLVAIGKHLEVDRNTVRNWIHRYKEGGMEALQINKRGPKEGTRMQLSQDQQDEIKKLLVDNFPEQLKFNFCLWTREAVGQLITQKTGLQLDLRQVGRYLKRWGFTPQKPIKRAYQRNEKKVNEWLDEQYPAIKKKAKSENAEIHWADETGLKSHDHRGRGYSPKGKTPIRMHNPSYEKVNLISSITNQGKLRFMCYEGRFNYKVYHKFLSQLIKGANGRKIYVIVDNHPTHHSKKIKRWLKKYQRLIEVHYLPSYSPDLNPDEYLNCDLKIQLAKRPERRKKGKWKSSVESTIKDLASQPERVASYFNAEPIQYAKAV